MEIKDKSVLALKTALDGNEEIVVSGATKAKTQQIADLANPYAKAVAMSTVNCAYRLRKNEDYEGSGVEYIVPTSYYFNYLYNQGLLKKASFHIFIYPFDSEDSVTVRDCDNITSVELTYVYLGTFVGTLDLGGGWIDVSEFEIQIDNPDAVIQQVMLVPGDIIPQAYSICAQDVPELKAEVLSDSKAYTDTKIGDIDTVLDSIIATQNTI